jgi:hypothetical protein
MVLQGGRRDTRTQLAKALCVLGAHQCTVPYFGAGDLES